MRIRPIPKFFTSIFTKLLLIILIAGFGINLAIIFFFGVYRHHIAASFHPHLTRYIAYLVKDMGDPPQLERARKIAAETAMVIAYESSNRKWTTGEYPILPPKGRHYIWHKKGSIQAGTHHGAHWVFVDQPGGRILFYLPRQAPAEKKIKVLSIALLLYITLLMVGAFLVIRWVLKPLRWLRHGVDQVAKGELAHRVPLKRSDELGDLSVSFNVMTQRIQQLVKAKEQLLLDVSHELRTPITRMKVALAMLAESSDKQNIEEDLNEMEDKINELLETARALKVKAALNLRPVDLGALIHDAAELFQDIRPGVQIKPLSPMPPCDVDARQVRKALKNILDNALKYSPDDGPPVSIAVTSQPPFAVITVIDRGIGIPKEDLDFIFEPFYRVDKSRTPQAGGYGLGLSLAKTIIEAHGGRIDIASTVGQGTTAQIYLPCTPYEK